ncbi:MAG: AI-2E family transporter [Lachnospiraceae bacterium]|uniref:AI-2E family transporter n=1 Tax=Candidatus Weimeria bifida TaxID=2599074 RepID=A0A6N7J2X8_9FIRM|nr:AI-2E family transporter [Candidatus Weimeria bifida]RRF96867.1 MAG: AI-2E family transporter [Lachnospiraceae bacterium]
MSEQTPEKKKRAEDYLSDQEKARYKVIAKRAFVVGLALILIYFIIARWGVISRGWGTVTKVFQPIVIGLIMAYLTNPVMKFFSNIINKLVDLYYKHTHKTRKKHPDGKPVEWIRILSTIIATLVILAAVLIFIVTVVPQFVSTMNELINHIHEKVRGVIDWADKITNYRFKDVMDSARDNKNIDNTIDKGVEIVRKYLNLQSQNQTLSTLTKWGMNAGKVIVNIIIGIFVNVYVLIEKEKFKNWSKKLIYVIFPVKPANYVMQTLRKADEVFYGFIVGKIIDSIIIGIICYFSMLILHFPYAVVCSVIIGVTNVIPIFGPYIGAVPTVALIFVTNPMQGIYFLIYVIVLQQIDGNFIGPKILGDSTGVSPFWVIFAITVGGGLFGIPGMIIGVPMVSLILWIIKRISDHFLRKRKMVVSSAVYQNLDYVDPQTGEYVQKKENKSKKYMGIVGKMLDKRKKQAPKK